MASNQVPDPMNEKEKPTEDKPVVKGLTDDPKDHEPIEIVSKDGKTFKLERKSAKISTLVSTAIDNDDKADSIPIPGVTGSTLALIIRYMQEHKGVEPPIIEKPLRSKVMSEVCPKKSDAEFIDEVGDTRQNLYDLILAANYMDIKSLLHLGCAKVASLIKGQPLEKIKEILDPNGKHAPIAQPKPKDTKESTTPKKDQKEGKEEPMKTD